jgi:hypothetical protein
LDLSSKFRGAGSNEYACSEIEIILPKYELSQIVELTKDIPERGLARGTRGAVVQVFDEPDEAYEIEVVDESGDTRAEFAVSPDQIRSVRSLVS